MENMNTVGNPDCPNRGLAELLSGVTFSREGTDVICGLCKRDSEQGACKKAQFTNGFVSGYKTAQESAADILLEL